MTTTDATYGDSLTPSHPPASRPPSSRNSSTGSTHSVRRKPLPTEFDQLRQLGHEVLGTAEGSQVDGEPVRPHEAGSRPNLLPTGFNVFTNAPSQPVTYPPAAVSREPSQVARTTPPSRPAEEAAAAGPRPVLPIPSTSLPSRYSVSSQTSSRAGGQSVFGTPPQGTVGTSEPRELIRIERDYSAGGDACQFWAGWIWELEGRVSPTDYQAMLDELNSILTSAYDPRKSILDNALAVLTLWISPLLLKTHYEREIRRFEQAMDRANREVMNPAGLNLVNPKRNAYLFLELEYY
ncbi:hypothetical protein JCM10212_002769 [Sporobolomyces blumeae]